MIGYPQNYNQIQPGYIDHDLVSRNLGNRGETSPRVRTMENGHYGRTLAGLGHAEFGGDEDYEDNKLETLEGQDDVVGSGIFDTEGSDATIHSDMGVFADHPNLPGYIAREVQFEPNEDLEDLATGAQVIGIPGGGMTNGGRLIGPGTVSAQQLPFRFDSQLTPPAPSTALTISRSPAVRPIAPRPAPLVSTMPRQVPLAAPSASPRRGCGCYAPPTPPRSFRGMGSAVTATEEPPKSSWVPYVAGGLLVGTAVALMIGTLSLKPGRAKGV